MVSCVMVTEHRGAFLSNFADGRLSLVQGYHQMAQRYSKKVIFSLGLKCGRGKVSLQLPNDSRRE